MRLLGFFLGRWNWKHPSSWWTWSSFGHHCGRSNCQSRTEESGWTCCCCKTWRGSADHCWQNSSLVRSRVYRDTPISHWILEVPDRILNICRTSWISSGSSGEVWIDLVGFHHGHRGLAKHLWTGTTKQLNCQCKYAKYHEILTPPTLWR